MGLRQIIELKLAVVKPNVDLNLKGCSRSTHVVGAVPEATAEANGRVKSNAQS